MTKYSSELSLSEFKTRLQENTKLGDPKLKGSVFASFTMFGKARRKFYGEIKDKKFRITKNGILFPIPYIINGNIKTSKYSKTEISYRLEKIWFGYLWIRIFPLIAIVAVNAILINHGQNMEKFLYIPINIFLLSMFTPILIVNRMKNRFIKRFHDTFELNTK